MIFLITYFFPPGISGAARRFYVLGKSLHQSGEDVVVVCPAEIDDTFGTSPPVDMSLNVVRVPNIMGKIRRERIGGKLKKSKLQEYLVPDRGVFWAVRTIYHFWINRKEISGNVVASTSPMCSTHIVAGFMAWIFDLKWYADIRDFYFVHYRNVSSPILVRWIHRRIEKWIMRRADRLSFVAPSMLRKYEESYPEIGDKSDVIYHGLKSRYCSAPEVSTHKIKIIYVGSFYDGERPIQSLLGALEYLDQTILQRLEIAIVGSNEKFLVERCSEKVQHIFQWHGSLNGDQLERLFQECHWGWITIPDKIHHKYTIPSKFYDYLSAGLALLTFAPLDSEVSKVMKEFTCGLFFTQDFSSDVKKERAKELFNDLLYPDKFRATNHIFTQMRSRFGIEVQLEKQKSIIEALTGKNG